MAARWCQEGKHAAGASLEERCSGRARRFCACVRSGAASERGTPASWGRLMIKVKLFAALGREEARVWPEDHDPPEGAT
ncbi:hypothetical protein MRX96_007782 [Rhipicephalus microplus]